MCSRLVALTIKYYHRDWKQFFAYANFGFFFFLRFIGFFIFHKALCYFPLFGISCKFVMPPSLSQVGLTIMPPSCPMSFCKPFVLSQFFLRRDIRILDLRSFLRPTSSNVL